MDNLKNIFKIIALLFTGVLISGLLNSCGGLGDIWDPPDAREVSPNVNERVKRNLEEGKGLSIEKLRGGVGGGGGTTYQFASSNPLWRSTLEILDFLPLANVDYSGGIITTDWYNQGTASDESIKITIRFLTNEIRSDGLRIIVHKKRCNIQQNCTIQKISSTLEQELRFAILKKAAIYDKEAKSKKKKKKHKRKDLN